MNVELVDIHCKGKFPREFGKKTKRSFIRNEYATSPETLARMCEFFDYEDCFVSVYSFEKFEYGEPWDRNTAIIDRIYIDLDCEENLRLPLKEALKIIDWYSRVFGVYPLVYFTGSKGFAVYLDFKPVKFRSSVEAKNTLRLFATLLVEQLELKTLDIQVTVDIARLSRIPLTLNTKSNLYCIPLNSKKLDKLQPCDVIHASKHKIYYIPEVEEAPNLDETLLELAQLDFVSERPTYNYNTSTSGDLYEMILNAPFSKYISKNMLKRIIHYTKVAVEKGNLSEDPTIVEIHSKSKHFKQLSKNGNVKGAIEHIARVHFVILLLLIGLNDEQIHEIFKHFKDYDPKKTQYFIEYNAKRLGEYVNSAYFLKRPIDAPAVHRA